MREVKAPNLISLSYEYRVFLAGSIEMGKAELWQDKVVKGLEGLEVVVFNPRRDDWDSSWKQNKNDPQFRQQVEWELNAMSGADLIVFYFDPNTKSPITLLELGMHLQDHIVVCCPEGFYRKGNVDIVCEHNGIRQVDNLEALIKITHDIVEDRTVGSW